MQFERQSLSGTIFLVIGLALCAGAISAPYLGLGETTNYLPYRWLYLSRTKTVYFGLFVAAAGIASIYAENILKFAAAVEILTISILAQARGAILVLPATGQALNVRPREIVASLRGKFTNASKARSVRPLTACALFAGQSLLLALIAGAMLWLNRAKIFGYIDGQYLLTLSRNQANFASPDLIFSSNPLQGLDDLWYTSANTRWLPELAVMRLFQDYQVQKVASQLVATLELFTVIFAFSYWMERSLPRAVASGWLAVLVYSPFAYPSLIYAVNADNVQFVSAIVFPLVIILLWAGVGRTSLWSDAARTGSIGALMWVQFIASGLFPILGYPFLAITSLVLVVRSWPERSEFSRKLAWGSVLAIFLVISGLPPMILGLITDSAFHMFPAEMARSGQSFNEGSLLLRPMEPIGIWIAALGLLSAILYGILGSGDIRSIAISVAILGCLIISASIALLFGISGPAIPIYYEVVLWGIYPVFVVSLLANVALVICDYIPAKACRKQSNAVWPWFALPFVGVIVFHGAHYRDDLYWGRPNVFPPKPTPLTEFLRDNVGLKVGGRFNGRVATMTGQRLPKGTQWDNLFELDMSFIRAVGNDHRDIGLWYYNIPTLTEFTVNTPPLFYLLVKKYLANEEDIQGRHILTMRHVNPRILQLVGVRYIITDTQQPTTGTLRSLTLAFPSGELAVDELRQPNLGFSPTQTIQLPDSDALNWLGSGETDLRRVAILAGPAPASLTESRDIAITIEQGGIRVHATSTGDSLLVVPFQYSHCLRATVEPGKPKPELRRADMLLTGILFNNEVDVRIEYRQGPFESADCRLKDRRDDINFALNFLTTPSEIATERAK